MGLTLHYNWKIKAEADAARRMVRRFRALALKLPWDEVSEIYEQDPPAGKTPFTRYNHSFRVGELYLSRRRADGEDEMVCVPARHAVFFRARISGAETVLVGLASHPAVVVHREDVIERHADGSESGRILGAGAPIEFPTRRKGWYSWHSFCKTQYAGNPKLGGEANFLRAHLTLVELLDQIQASGVKLQARDDSGYWRRRNADRLLATLREWDALIANFVGKFSDALGDSAVPLMAPIKERPDFEHLEAKGVEVLRRMARRQRRRGKR